MPAKSVGVLTDAQKHQLAEEIIDYLTQQGMFWEVNIFTGKHWYSDTTDHKSDGPFRPHKTKNGSKYYKAGHKGCPCEYNNPDTLTMTFEGPLYHDLNYGDWDKGAWAALNRIAEPYGLYHEMGHAWSLAFYT